MKTEIKDYLPLYLGCKFKHDSDVGTYELCGYNIYNDHVQNALGMDTYSSKGTRLILRKLSDMTEEDGGRIFGSRKKYMLYKKERDANPTDFFLFTPLEFSHLLKDGFDLYNLIHEGLAIDKATLKAS
jgi:hypothetical protein